MAFISQEAREKAREIQVKADEEFAIEKVSPVKPPVSTPRSPKTLGSRTERDDDREAPSRDGLNEADTVYRQRS